MADFDLSMVATFDASSVATGSKQVEDGINKMSAAETRGAAASKAAATAQQAAANAERERSASLARILALIDPNAAGQARLNKSLADADRLYKSGAISAAQYARVQQLASAALKGGAQNANQARASYQNLGFQIQDITQTLALGINPFVVFGQQAGQTASALSGFGGKLGAVATFLSGPFGAAILGAVTVIGLLSTKLFENSDASDTAEKAAADLADRMSDISTFFDKATGAVIRNSQALIANARLQRLDALDKIRGDQSTRAKSIRDLVDGSSSGSARFGGTFGNETGRVNITRPGKSDIQRAISQAGGDQTAISNALLGIARSNSGNAGRARKILELRGQAFDDRNKFKELNLEDESLRTGVLDKSLRDQKAGGRTRRASGGSVDKAVRQAEQLAKFGDAAEEKISRLNEAFDETPKLVDRAAQATRELDDIIKDLEKRKPPGFENLIATAQAAKVVVAESLNRPFQELLENSERRLNVEKLIGAGREDEARALEIIYQQTDKIGKLTEDQKNDILDMVTRERELNEVLAVRRELTDAYLSATQNIKSELESILSGRGGNILKALKQSFQDIQGKILTEKLFGPALRELDKVVKGENGIDAAVDIFANQTGRAGKESGNLADAFVDATKTIRGASAPTGGYTAPVDLGTGGVGGSVNPTEKAIEEATGEIAAVGKKIEKGALGLTPDEYFKRLTSGIASPLLDGLDDAFGTKFFSGLSGVISGALYGLATGGKPGGVLGGLKGLNDKFGASIFGAGAAGKIGETLGIGLGGSQTGTQIAGLAKSVGFKKFSTTGAQAGGAIGAISGIPGGELIGSIAGGIIGSLFKKTPNGSVVLSGGNATVSGSSKVRDSLTGIGGSFNDSLKQIADRLGAELGNYNVSIGQRDDVFRVSGSGATNVGTKKTKNIKDLIYDGKDEGEAIKAAIRNAIGDGAIKGISEAMQRALKASPDIDKAISDALGVRALEDLLSGLSDAEKAFRDFDKTAAERVRLARAYGLDIVAVEKLNADERKKLLEQALESQVGSLKALLKDLSYGSLFDGTATERRSKILAEIADAEQDIAANVDGAINRYADLQRQLVETSREAFGTAGPEFTTDRSSAISNAERIIQLENDRIAAAAAKQQEQTDALNQNNNLTNETNNLLAVNNASLANIGAYLAQMSLNGGGAQASIVRNVEVQF